MDRLRIERNLGLVSFLGRSVEDRKRVESKISFLFQNRIQQVLDRKVMPYENPYAESFF